MMYENFTPILKTQERPEGDCEWYRRTDLSIQQRTTAAVEGHFKNVINSNNAHTVT